MAETVPGANLPPGEKGRGRPPRASNGDFYQGTPADDTSGGESVDMSHLVADEYPEERRALSKHSRSNQRSSRSVGDRLLRRRRRSDRLLLAFFSKAIIVTVSIFVVSVLSLRIFVCLKEASSSLGRAADSPRGVPFSKSRANKASSPASRRLADSNEELVTPVYYTPLGPPPLYSSVVGQGDEPQETSLFEPAPPYEAEGTPPPPSYVERCVAYASNPALAVVENGYTQLHLASGLPGDASGAADLAHTLIKLSEIVGTVIALGLTLWFVFRLLTTRFHTELAGSGPSPTSQPFNNSSVANFSTPELSTGKPLTGSQASQLSTNVSETSQPASELVTDVSVTGSPSPELSPSTPLTNSLNAETSSDTSVADAVTSVLHAISVTASPASHLPSGVTPRNSTTTRNFLADTKADLVIASAAVILLVVFISCWRRRRKSFV